MMDADRIRSRLLLWRHFPRVLRLAARRRGRALGGIAAWIASGLLSLGFPFALKVFVDNILTRGEIQLLPALAAFVAVVIALRAACEAASTLLLGRARAETTADARMDVHARILGAPIAAIEFHKTAALHDRVLRDLEAVMSLLYGAGPMFLQSLALFLGAAAVCLWMDWRLSLIGMALVPPFLAVSLVWVRRLRPRYKELSERRSQFGAALQQHYAGARILKAFARERWAVERAGRMQSDLVEEQMRLTVQQALLAAVSALVTGAGLVALLWAGSRLVHGGGITPGRLMALYASLAYLAASVHSLVSQANTIQQSLASAERVFELADVPPETHEHPARTDEPALPLEPADLVIRGLVFGYPQEPARSDKSDKSDRSDLSDRSDPPDAARSRRRVLDGLNLELPAGGMVALVGPSGVGKTTTAALVTRLLRPDAGAIYWGGCDVSAIPLETWRNGLAVVQQEDWLLAASVRENVALGRNPQFSIPNPQSAIPNLQSAIPNSQSPIRNPQSAIHNPQSAIPNPQSPIRNPQSPIPNPQSPIRNSQDAAIRRALELACALKLVESLPDGLDTELGERGHRLSGGERQRICLARALLGNPRLLLLDEATSAMDLKTEAEILANLRRLPVPASVLVISHRLSAVAAADRVYYLEDGRIREEGAHAELLALGGRYAEFYALHHAPEHTGEAAAP
jgi:ABC-type multidrug transport system fused ATPase/permease subunit